MQQGPIIDGVAWARLGSTNGNSGGAIEPGSGQMVGIAQGHFDRDAIRSFLNMRNISGIQVGDAVMYGAGTGPGTSDIFFILTSDQTIAFGNEAALKRMLRAGAGEEANLLTNEKMMELIGEVNGGDVFWGVFGAKGAQSAATAMFSDAAKFPQGRDLITKMKEISIAVKAPGDIELEVQAVAASPSDALLLSQLLQAGLIYRQQASSRDNPDLSRILTRARLSANGNRLEFSLGMDDDQVLSLIEHDTFRVPM
ncbi:MAG: hypothetical protein ACRD3S_11455 [Terracidiphilus sp.]